MLIPTTVLTNPSGAVWADYTPTLTAASVNPTMGTGSSLTGRYCSDGKLVVGFAVISFGSSGAAAGTGEYRVSIPLNVGGSFLAAPFVGSCFAFDASSGSGRVGIVRRRSGANDLIMWIDSATATVTDASPWVWDNNDAIFCYFSYESV